VGSAATIRVARLSLVLFSYSLILLPDLTTRVARLNLANVVDSCRDPIRLSACLAQHSQCVRHALSRDLVVAYHTHSVRVRARHDEEPNPCGRELGYQLRGGERMRLARRQAEVEQIRLRRLDFKAQLA